MKLNPSLIPTRRAVRRCIARLVASAALPLVAAVVTAPAQAADVVLPSWTFGIGPIDYNIEVGDSVFWPNPISASHDVSSVTTQADYDSCNILASTLIAPGGTANFSVNFDTPGTYYYMCSRGGARTVPGA